MLFGERGGFLRSLRSLIGLAVLCHGKPIGHVAAVLLDGQLRAIQALYFDGPLSGTRRVEGAQVKLLGRVSVMVEDKGRRARLREEPIRRALSTSGVRLGAITGALIDQRSGRVAALELSRGFWEDLTQGRQWVFHYAVNRDSEDVLLMSEGGEKP